MRKAPSSDPSGHLLPAGEKRSQEAICLRRSLGDLSSGAILTDVPISFEKSDHWFGSWLENMQKRLDGKG